MTPSARTAEDRVLERVREALAAASFDEALTVSVVEHEWSEAFSPWTDRAPLETSMPLLRRATCLRRSLIPSLLGARRTNESLSNPDVELYEIARVYLPRAGQLPDEMLMLGMTSGGDVAGVKGTIETIVERANPALQLTVEPYTHELFAAGAGGRLLLDGQVFGYLGLLSAAGMKRFELRHPAAVAEIRLSPLMEKALLVPQYHPLSMQPAIVRDINLVVDETRQWRDLENCIRQTAGNLLERLDYRDTYRDAERLGAGKKSWLVSLQLRHAEATLTSAEADALRDRIVVACRAALGAELRA